MSMTSKVMLGSPLAGSDVGRRGGIPPFEAAAWVAVWGFSGGRQALRFLRVGFLGAGSSFCAPSPEENTRVSQQKQDENVLSIKIK